LKYTMTGKSTWIPTGPIAHRGLFENKEIPENSMAAFDLALMKGYPVEFDTRLLSDGEVAVFHDEGLLRMTGINTLINEVDTTSLCGVKLLGTDEKIPLLRNVLSLVSGRVPMLIEIKNRGRAGKLEQRVSELLREYRGEFAVQSFNPYSLGWFKEHAPEIPRGQLSGDFRGEKLPFYKKFILRNFFMNWLSKPDFIGYDIRLLPCRVVRAMKKKGLAVVGWTASTEEEFLRAADYCDAIVFEGFRP